MKVQGLVTRVISAADETIQVFTEDTDFEDFQSNVLSALAACDYRAHTQMQRLFEDSSLQYVLDETEFGQAQEAASLMYPVSDLESQCSGTKIEFTKNLASGEVLKVFISDLTTEDDITKLLYDIWNLIDERLQDTNSREMAFTEYYRTLSPECQLKVGIVMEALYGRQTLEQVRARLSQGQREDFEQAMARMRSEMQATAQRHSNGQDHL